MPIRFVIMCEKCERIYLLTHPRNRTRIRFIPGAAGSAPHPPYRLTCICNAECYFGRAQPLPYRVSEYICSKGHAERDEYEALLNPKSSETRRDRPH